VWSRRSKGESMHSTSSAAASARSPQRTR
jgi:hypothetical protein